MWAAPTMLQPQRQTTELGPAAVGAELKLLVECVRLLTHAIPVSGGALCRARGVCRPDPFARGSAWLSSLLAVLPQALLQCSPEPC